MAVQAEIITRYKLHDFDHCEQLPCCDECGTRIDAATESTLFRIDDRWYCPVCFHELIK